MQTKQQKSLEATKISAKFIRYSLCDLLFCIKIFKHLQQFLFEFSALIVGINDVERINFWYGN